MYVSAITLHRWTERGQLEGSVQISGPTAKLSIDLTPEEINAIEEIAVKAHERNRAEMVKQLEKPLSTNLLPPPPPGFVEGEFTEVEDAPGVQF